MLLKGESSHHLLGYLWSTDRTARNPKIYQIKIMSLSQYRRSSDSIELSESDEIKPIPALDWLLPKNHANQSDETYRGRILVGMLMSYSLLLILGSIYFYFFTELTEQLKMQAIIGTLPLCFILPSIIYFYRRTNAFLLCANIAVAITFVGITAAVITTGGPFISPTTSMVPVPALLAFCMCGRFSGYTWAVIVLLTHIVLMATAVSGFRFLDVLITDTSHINTIFDWMIAYSAMITTVALYENMQGRLKKERDGQHQKYIHLATHDQLTRLPNRVLFYDRLKRAMTRAQQENTIFAVLYLDLDGFKPINDQYGHEAGDLVLEETAERLFESVRESDTIARLGGDEFAVILENIGETAIAEDIARKIAFKICKPISLIDKDVRTKASIGIAYFPEDGSSRDELIRRADVAMYHAKKHADMCVSYQQVVSNQQ